ncbi:hypothetical protein [Streptomyces sp. JW3]
MLKDPYAVLRALLRAEASRNNPSPEPRPAPTTSQVRKHPAPERDRG